MSILVWLFSNWEILVEAGEVTVDFATWASEQIKKLFSEAESPDEVTVEMLDKLAAEWPGALPLAEDVFDEELLEEDDEEEE